MDIITAASSIKCGSIQICLDDDNVFLLEKILKRAFPNGHHFDERDKYFRNTPQSATLMVNGCKKPFKNLQIVNTSTIQDIQLLKGENVLVHFGCNSGWVNASYSGILNGKWVVDMGGGRLTDSFIDIKHNK